MSASHVWALSVQILGFPITTYVSKNYRRRGRRGRAIEAAYNASTKPKTLNRLSWSLNSTVAIGVATNLNAPPSALRRIARWHTDPSVIERIPHNPNASAKTLLLVTKKHSAMHPAALLSIVKRRDCPPEILDQVCARKLKGGHLAAEWLASSSQTQERLLRALYQNWVEPSVVIGLAGNQQTPREILIAVMESSQDEAILSALANNRSLREDERVLTALRLLSISKTG